MPAGLHGLANDVRRQSASWKHTPRDRKLPARDCTTHLRFLTSRELFNVDPDQASGRYDGP